MEIRQYYEGISLVRLWSRVARPSEMASLDDPRELQRQIKKCRTVFWYHSLSLLHDLSSARAMQRLFVPDSFKRRTGSKTHDSSIFRKYRAGSHQPTHSTLLKVEKVSPGSSAALKHLLWDVLIQIEFTHNKSQRLLKRLPYELQSHIFAKDGHGRLNRVTEASIIYALTGRYDIAVLTAFTILAREAIFSQNWPEADLWSKQLLFAFVGLCGSLQRAGIGQQMFEIYESLVFSRTVVAGKRYRNLPEIVESKRLTFDVAWFSDGDKLVATYAGREDCADMQIRYEDCIRPLRIARTTAKNAYRGIAVRRPTPVIQNHGTVRC